MSYLNTLNNLFKLAFESKKKFSAFSLFTGIGGLDLGFEAAGFNVEGFIELVPKLSAIYKLNFPNVLQMGSDITKLTAHDYQQIKSLGHVDVVIGGPPCQGFSMAGKRAVDDPRNQLFLHYLEIVDLLKPSICVFENVTGFKTMKNVQGERVADVVMKAFEAHGYEPHIQIVNAAEFGVPQARRRTVIIALRKDKGLNWLPLDNFKKYRDKSRQLTFRNACGDLMVIESGQKSNDILHFAPNHKPYIVEMLKFVKEGDSAHNLPDELVHLRPSSGYASTYKRKRWDKPSETITTKFSDVGSTTNVHPQQSRGLSIREAMRLQSFPDEYKMGDNFGAMRTGIGNAVPPLLAYHLGLLCKKVLDNDK